MTDTFDYTRAVATAVRLITKFGTAAALRRNVASGTPFDPVLTPTDYATTAARVDFTWRQLQTGDVLATDQRFLVAAGPLSLLGVTNVTPPDTLVVAGIEFTIVKADPLDPTLALPVMYDCQVRV